MLRLVPKPPQRKVVWEFIGERLLRSYEHIAHVEHTCDACPIPIFPGDDYFGSVWVHTYLADGKRRTYLFIKKQHGTCPWDPDEEERILKEIDDLPEENSEDSDRSEAA